VQLPLPLATGQEEAEQKEEEAIGAGEFCRRAAKRQPPVAASSHIKIIVCQRIHYPWQPAILAKDIKNAISGRKKKESGNAEEK